MTAAQPNAAHPELLRGREVSPLNRLPTPHRSALRSLAQSLNEAGIEWRLGGSAMLAAMGVGVDVHDLDVTVPADALEDVRTACHPWMRDVLIGQAPPPWCSAWLAKLDVDDVGVDVIGGFCVQGPSGPVRVPQDLGGALDLEDVVVPLADPAAWWWVYRLYQPAKADALAQIVPAEHRAAMDSRLGGASHGS